MADVLASELIWSMERTPVNGAGYAIGAILLIIGLVSVFGGRGHR